LKEDKYKRRIDKNNMGKKSALTLGIILLIALWCFVPVIAAGEKTEQEGSFGINLVYPPEQTPGSYFLYELAPGKSQRHEIDLFNNLSYAVKVSIYSGDCYNTLDGTLAGPLYGEKSQKVGTWVKMEAQEVELAPGKKKRVGFTLTVPENTKTGDYFGFIFVQPSSLAEDKNKKAGNEQGKAANASFTVKLQQRLGVCLVARVPGEKKVGLEITSVKKSVDSKGQLSLLVDIANTGNIYLKPAGAWELKNAAGETVLSQNATQLGYLLPDYPIQIKIPVLTSRPLATGNYELFLTVEYDNQKADKNFKIQLP
jgi:hypothetical protein